MYSEEHFTHFNYFDGCWIKSLGLLHNFTLNSFINLISYSADAHNVLLNFYGGKNIVVQNLFPIFVKKILSDSIELNTEELTLHHAFVFAERDRLVDNPSRTVNGNFLKVLHCTLLWSLQPRSYNMSR